MKITNCDLMNNRCEMVLESLNKKLLENLKNLKGNAILMVYQKLPLVITNVIYNIYCVYVYKYISRYIDV